MREKLLAAVIFTMALVVLFSDKWRSKSTPQVFVPAEHLRIKDKYASARNLHTLRIVNDSKSDLFVSSISPSCSCLTEVSPASLTVLKGQSAEIRLVLNLISKFDFTDSTFLQQEVPLTLKGRLNGTEWELNLSLVGSTYLPGRFTPRHPVLPEGKTCEVQFVSKEPLVKLEQVGVEDQIRCLITKNNDLSFSLSISEAVGSSNSASTELNLRAHTKSGELIPLVLPIVRNFTRTPATIFAGVLPLGSVTEVDLTSHFTTADGLPELKFTADSEQVEVFVREEKVIVAIKCGEVGNHSVSVASSTEGRAQSTQVVHVRWYGEGIQDEGASNGS